jgi:hypothetical protein
MAYAKAEIFGDCERKPDMGRLSRIPTLQDLEGTDSQLNTVSLP